MFPGPRAHGPPALAAALILVRKRTAQKPQLASPHFDEDAYQVEMEPAPPLLNSILTLQRSQFS